jgi:hypothetical protein
MEIAMSELAKDKGRSTDLESDVPGGRHKALPISSRHRTIHTSSEGFPMPNSRIKQASDATDQIQHFVGIANNALAGFNGRIMNGWGIYADVSTQLQKLGTALDALRQASKVFAATNWPTNDDYDNA